ncbi:MAG TPA: MetQ/NlpA family ABC transporter substrate-binding protein [Bacillota bacterium]|nr:MetQ/NlpA family ABC transporter substrate-binding protein [Bacillota bacterium]
MKKLIPFLSASILALGLLAGCGSQKQEGSAQPASGATPAKQAAVLTVGATSVPHAEILNAAKPLLQEKGIELKVQEFNDYVLPNTSLEDKQLDANFFQHVPYLESFNKDHGTHLVSAFPVHFEPLGLYAGKQKTLDNIPDNAVIAVPNDPSNEARALLLLQSKGVIKLPENADLKATPKDIKENPHKVQIKELDASFIARSLADVDYAVINGNFALQAGLKSSDALAMEDKNSLAAKTFANVVVVRQGDENKEAIKTLKEVLASDKIKQFIESKYNGSVIPVN